MKSMLTFCRWVIYATSLGYLGVSLKGKTKANITASIHCAIGSIIYLIADLFLFPVLCDIEYGQGLFIITATTVLFSFIFIAAIIYGQKRLKVMTSNNNEKKARWPVSYLLLGVMWIAMFLLEIEIYQDAHIIFKNTTENNPYYIAVTDHALIKTEMGPKYFAHAKVTKTSDTNENINQQFLEAYTNDMLNDVDINNITQKQCNITTIENSNYYTVVYTLSYVDDENQIKTIDTPTQLFLNDQLLGVLESPWDEVYICA